MGYYFGYIELIPAILCDFLKIMIFIMEVYDWNDSVKTYSTSKAFCSVGFGAVQVKSDVLKLHRCRVIG